MKTHFLLVLILLFGAFQVVAQDATEIVDSVPTQEILATVAVPAPEIVEVVEAAPSELEQFLIDANIMAIAGSLILIVGFGGAYVLIFRSIDALKVSVPQETTNMLGQQIADAIIKIRADLWREANKSATPIDNMVMAIADIPLDVLVKEIKRRNVPPAPDAVGISQSPPLNG